MLLGFLGSGPLPELTNSGMSLSVVGWLDWGGGFWGDWKKQKKCA